VYGRDALSHADPPQGQNRDESARFGVQLQADDGDIGAANLDGGDEGLRGPLSELFEAQFKLNSARQGRPLKNTKSVTAKIPARSSAL
jgi:hypothetical protein